VGGPKRRVWRKIHLGIDEETLEVRAVEITGSHIGDAPILPDLLGQIPAEEEIASVTADGAYDTRKCHDAIHCPAVHVYMHERGRPWCECRHPTPQKRQAVEDRHSGCGGQKRGLASFEIPRPRDLAKLEWIPPPESRRNETSRDHASHNPVGQRMHCMKLLGQRLMARDFDRQVAEVQVRIAVMNGYTALGIPVTEAVG
jgi:hypothetical protein